MYKLATDLHEIPKRPNQNNAYFSRSGYVYVSQTLMYHKIDSPPQCAINHHPPSTPILRLMPEKQSPIDPHSPIPNLLAIVVSLQLRRGENRRLVGMVVSGHLDRDTQWVVMVLSMDGDRGGAGSNVSGDGAHQSLVV